MAGEGLGRGPFRIAPSRGGGARHRPSEVVGRAWAGAPNTAEMGPPFGVVPDPVAVPLEPHSARIQGRQGLRGVQHRLSVQRDFGDIRRGASAAPLHFPPLLRGAPKVTCLVFMPEGSALNLLEALLALGFSQPHEATFEGASHRHSVAKHALGCRRKTSHGGEHSACRERRVRGLRGGGGSAPLGVPVGGSAGSGELGACPRRGLSHRWRVADLEATGWGELGVDFPLAEHRALYICHIRMGLGHWTQVVLQRAGDRVCVIIETIKNSGRCVCMDGCVSIVAGL